MLNWIYNGCLVFLALKSINNSKVDPRLLVSKVYNPTSLAVGQINEVEYRFVNLGHLILNDIEVSDETFEEGFEIIQGAFPLKIPELGPLQNFTLKVWIRPQFIGTFIDESALVSFNRSIIIPNNSEKIQLERVNASSFSKGLMNVMTEEQFHAQVASHPYEWILIFCLISLILAWPYYLYRRNLLNFRALTLPKAKSK